MQISERDLERFGRAIWPDLTPQSATAINQAKFGLSRILPVIEPLAGPDCRILEVGAGRMVLSAYLAYKGFGVTALEPLTPDFRWYDPLQSDVLAYCAREGIMFDRVETTVEQYVAPEQYDFVFSIHVLEHVSEPFHALENMYQNLKPSGVLLTLCPNYDVPFEPHFGIVLLGRSKPFNAKVYRQRVSAKPDLWNRLVFVRYSVIRRYLEGKRIRYSFNRHILRDMFLRLGKDELFYARMPAPVRWAYYALRSVGAIDLLSLLPARLQTPMEILVVK